LPLAKLPYRRAASTATPATRWASGFYTGNSASAPLNELPRRPPIHAGPQQPARPQLKPFHTVYREPTVSPYLNLYREENDSESAPNYFAFVRPQLEQVEANRAQQAQLQQLSRQLQRPATIAGPRYRADGAPGASSAARYMDTAQFYGSWCQ
jgi:hypothetical protein